MLKGVGELKNVIISMVLLVMIVIAGCGSSSPDYPTALTGTNGTGQEYLSWYAAPGATGYNVYRGTVSGPVSSKTMIASNLSTTYYTDATVIPGNNYFYQVTAILSTGESKASNEVNVVP